MTTETLERQIELVAINAMYELRDTIRPTFNASELGYRSADHARETIVKLADKELNKLATAILRRDGK